MPFIYFFKNTIIVIYREKMETSMGNTSSQKVIPSGKGERGVELGCVSKRPHLSSLF